MATGEQDDNEQDWRKGVGGHLNRITRGKDMD